MPLPDEDGRSRLLDLYAKGLELELRDRASFIAATAGAAPRGLLATECGEGTRITDVLLAGAIQALRQGIDELTGSLLSAQPAPAVQS